MQNGHREEPVVRPTAREDPGPGQISDGVDVTLIRWMLSMSPADRLMTLQNNIRSIMRLRDAGPGA